MAKAQGEEAFNKRRVRFSYAGVVLSIGLVLFLTGIMATLAYQSRVLTDDLKENFTFTLFLKSDATQEKADAFIKDWSDEPEIRSLRFVGKEEAAEQFQKDLGEEFVDFLGFNPLSDAIDVKLKADFVSPDQLAKLQERFLKASIVENLVYDRDLVSVIHQNVGKINTAMLAAVAILLLVSLMLINNALRLAIYARRFTLKTMQLVGATKAFIHKPFLKEGLILGALGGLTAAVLLAGTYALLINEWPRLAVSLTWSLWGSLAAAQVLIGIALTTASTALAVRRYLALNTNQLYER
jgi:cell division transport system permease protein